MRKIFKILDQARLDDTWELDDEGCTVHGFAYLLRGSQAETVFSFFADKKLETAACEENGAAVIIGATILYEEFPDGRVRTCCIAPTVETAGSTTDLSPYDIDDENVINWLRERSSNGRIKVKV